MTKKDKKPSKKKDDHVMEVLHDIEETEHRIEEVEHRIEKEERIIENELHQLREEQRAMDIWIILVVVLGIIITIGAIGYHFQQGGTQPTDRPVPSIMPTAVPGEVPSLDTLAPSSLLDSARVPLTDLGGASCGPNITLFYAPSSLNSVKARDALQRMGERITFAEACVGFSPRDAAECEQLDGAEVFARTMGLVRRLNATGAFTGVPTELIGCRYLRSGTFAHLNQKAEDAELETLVCALSNPMPDWCAVDVRYARPPGCTTCESFDKLVGAISNPRARLVEGTAPQMAGREPPYILMPKELLYYDTRLAETVESLVMGEMGSITYTAMENHWVFIPPQELVATLVEVPCPICPVAPLGSVIKDIQSMGGRVVEGDQSKVRPIAPGLYIEAEVVRSNYPAIQALLNKYKDLLRFTNLDETDPNTPLVIYPLIYARADNSCGNATDAYLFVFYTPNDAASEGVAVTSQVLTELFEDELHIRTECVKTKEGDATICAADDPEGYMEAEQLRAIFGLRDVPAYVFNCRYVWPETLFTDDPTANKDRIVAEVEVLRKNLCILLDHNHTACGEMHGSLAIPMMG